MVHLRVCLLAVLTVPCYNFCTMHRPLARSIARRPHLRVPAAIAQIDNEDAANAYRKLGLDEDATYDQVTETFIELSERYQDDPARVADLEGAKDTVVNYVLSQRMKGARKASYEGMLSVDDRPEIPKTPLWEIVSTFSKKIITPPSPKYALRVVALLGGLTFATWLAPSTAGTIILINVMSGMGEHAGTAGTREPCRTPSPRARHALPPPRAPVALTCSAGRARLHAGFVYNRGEAEVARDDFGQIGEIRPMQPKPFILTAAITSIFVIFGWVKAKGMIATMLARGVTPPRTLEAVLRCTIISLGLILPALFVRVHSVFD